MKKWYVIKTKTNQEKKALANLSRQGFEIFCPLSPFLKKLKNSITKVFSPLFPSYMFIRLDLDIDGWRKINNTYGVKEILRNNSMYPGSISTDFIENLKKACDSNNCINDSYFNFEVGQRVKFIDGPFMNRIVEIVKMSSRDRVLVLQEIFSLKITVLVSKNKVIPV